MPRPRSARAGSIGGMKTILFEDGRKRCHWCSSTPEYIAYHDREWGFPVDDDRRLFEKLSLEGFQSGLSWRTILMKRDNFRAAFQRFDFDKVARFTARDVARLLKDAGIVRHRGKIEAVINNRAARADGQGRGARWRRSSGSTRRRRKRPGPCSCRRPRIHRAFERTQEARLEVRRPDDGLRLHAGHGPRE